MARRDWQGLFFSLRSVFFLLTFKSSIDIGSFPSYMALPQKRGAFAHVAGTVVSHKALELLCLKYTFFPIIVGRDSNGILILCSKTTEKLQTITGHIGDLDLKLDAERDATSNNIKTTKF